MDFLNELNLQMICCLCIAWRFA